MCATLLRLMTCVVNAFRFRFVVFGQGNFARDVIADKGFFVLYAFFFFLKLRKREHRKKADENRAYANAARGIARIQKNEGARCGQGHSHNATDNS